ncbi:MAG: hypothetical protein IH846_09795 [Acidobacteria bacterium]|nr:hypothetical protein [Acidobacteriota bacterium]
MKCCNVKVVLAGVVATVWLYTGISAQGQNRETAAREAGRVSLGTTSGSAGDLIVVPIYFSPAQGVEVGLLKLEISYVSANLKFANLEAGIAATTGGLELRSEVKEAKNDKGVDTQTLQITTSFRSTGPPQKGSPEGLLAYIHMKVGESARSASITLRGSAEASELGSNQRLQKLQSFETTVDVFGADAQPMLACFFFTH